MKRDGRHRSTYLRRRNTGSALNWGNAGFFGGHRLQSEL
ncbi:hypothetical protein MASSI9I_50065 [Massilia sp. 9I]|nr:hypothetical protein MASSI9I_50065 [Massilia sp. 9I]